MSSQPDSSQGKLSGATPPAAHLTATLPRTVDENQTAGDREWYCQTCGARITIGTDGTTEYGHLRTGLESNGGPCPHHIYGGLSSPGGRDE